MRDLVDLDEDVVDGKEVTLACVRRAVCGMLYADDAGIVSMSAEVLVKMMTVIATVFEAAGLTVSENKTGTMLLRTQDQTSLALPLVSKAAAQRYRQTAQCILHESADLSLEIERFISFMRARLRRFGWYDYRRA